MNAPRDCPDCVPRTVAPSGQSRGPTATDPSDDRPPIRVDFRHPFRAQAAPDGRTILAFGKLRGKTFEEAVRCDLRYCRWFLESAQKDPDASAECSENFAAFLAYLGPALGRIGSASSYCPPANAAEGIDLASGSWPVEFGKHKGLSFKASVLDTSSPALRILDSLGV